MNEGINVNDVKYLIEKGLSVAVPLHGHLSENILDP